MDINAKLTIPPKVVSREVGDETVLLDLESGIYFGLNRVGNDIWDAVSKGKSLSEAAELLVEAYAVDAEQARADVLELAGQLVERELLAE